MKIQLRNNNQGFSLVEIMIVVVVFLVILSSVIALTTDKTPREDLDAKAREAVDIISRAHNYALTGYQADNWGIKVLDTSPDCVLTGTGDCLILYKGKSYVDRNSVYDEIMHFDSGAYIEWDQINEFYFKKSSGWMASSTSITDQVIIIKNNFDSQKIVTSTLSGLVYFGD